jgi:carboxylesterase
MKGSEPIFIHKHSAIGILLIHGFTSTPSQFKELSVYLADKGFTVYAPRIAGHGTTPEDLMTKSPKDFVASAKEAYLELKKECSQVFIIGNSFGSNLAFWLAKEFNNEPIGIVTLAAPIFLRKHRLSVVRMYSYGLFKKYYHKPPRLYETDYTDMSDEVTYPVVPIRNLRQFIKFIKTDTIPSLKTITVPTLISHAKTDPVIHPRSATYIYEHLGSSYKRIYWFLSNYHSVTIDSRRKEVFSKIFNFIQEITKTNGTT